MSELTDDGILELTFPFVLAMCILYINMLSRVTPRYVGLSVCEGVAVPHDVEVFHSISVP